MRIRGIDDTGQRFGPVSLSLDANETVNFNSTHLERGNESKGLSGGIGDGQGNWRLDLDTTLDIEPLAYVRSGDGSLAAVHDAVTARSMRHHVLTFNPGSNLDKRSLLRLVNTSGIDTDVVITGLDDAGAAAAAEVRLTLPADEARTLSARELEEGGDGFEGSFGDGAGKWQVFVTAGRPIQVMSLLASPGNLVNLSAGPTDDTIRGGPGSDELWGSNGDDVLDPGDNADYDIVNGSAGDDMIVYTGSGPAAYQQIDYAELGSRITVTIDGVDNRGSIDKDSAGTDALVDIANPLDAGWSPPFGGFAIAGTRFSDTFHLTLKPQEQWMVVEGRAGNDTINIRSGAVQVDYARAPGGVNVDLGAGRAENDGYGGTDTINGRVWEVRGSDFSDVIVGSGNNESFRGRLGNDRLDGGGGWDRLDFRGFTDRDSEGNVTQIAIEDLNVDLARGTATGTWNGQPFSYTISNFERVAGGAGDDVITLGIEQASVDASAGNDRIVFTDSTGNTYGSVEYRSLAGNGIRVTLDGNGARVDKGPAGTDTIEGLAALLAADGFGLYGTSSNDIFNLTLRDQWMQVGGLAGNDTFNVSGCFCRIDYRAAPGGIHVDLGAGRARNDGYGDTDTISGSVWEIRGSDFADTIIGSANNESFIGRRGNDTIDGGGGRDRLRFDRSSWNTIRNLVVNLAEGTATGTWDGEAFTYRISNIEDVRGSADADFLVGNTGNNRLRGGAGEDRFVFDPAWGDDVIEDFTNGEDVIVLRGLGVSKSDVLANAGPWSEGTGTWINLTAQGGGAISLGGFDFANLDESDFLL